MSTSSTKIEMVVEAIESLTLAQVASVDPHLDDYGRHIAVKNVADARENLTSALRDFLQPTLRVVAADDDYLPSMAKG